MSKKRFALLISFIVMIACIPLAGLGMDEGMGDNDRVKVLALMDHGYGSQQVLQERDV